MILIEKHFKNIEETIQNLPSRLNFKIGETSEILSLPTYILRYWEKEIPLLKPAKFINKQRLYSRKDIQTLLLIKALLYEERFSVEGLRKHLPYYLKQIKSSQKQAPGNLKQSSLNLEKKAEELLALLSQMKNNLKSQRF